MKPVSVSEYLYLEAPFRGWDKTNALPLVVDVKHYPNRLPDISYRLRLRLAGTTIAENYSRGDADMADAVRGLLRRAAGLEDE